MDPQGSDDFSDMRMYRPGDPVRHVIWRAYARTDELVVKEYTSYLDPRLMLDYDRVAGPDSSCIPSPRARQCARKRAK